MSEDRRKELLGDRYEELKAALLDILRDAGRLAADLGEMKIFDLFDDLKEAAAKPFLIVVLGEIKSGKSSFINALLGVDVCGVDPAPCTDRIHEIVYAEQNTETALGENLVRIGLPVELLKEITIVDTPGTNTLVQRHQEITRGFIPKSGIVFFVFPAKNPHTLSAWRLLEFVADEWKKKVVFILQQSDLATERELEVNRKSVEDYAKKRRIDDPVIFAVSAVLEEKRNGEGGFEAVRSFIRDAVFYKRHMKLKLQSMADASEKLLGEIYVRLGEMKKECAAGKKSAERIETALKEAEDSIEKEVEFLSSHLLDNYDRASERFAREIAEGLSAPNLIKRGFASIWGKGKKTQDWIESKRLDFQSGMSVVSGEIALAVSARIRSILSSLSSRIEAYLTGAGAMHLPNGHKMTGVDEKRKEVLSEVQKRIKALSSENIMVSLEDMDAMSGQFLGGGIAAVAGIVMYATHIAVVDVTGGILAGAGLILASGVLVVKKKKILSELAKAIRGARDRFEQEISDRLKIRLMMVIEDLRKDIIPFFDAIEDEMKRVESLEMKGEKIHRRLVEISGKIAEM